MQKNSLCHSLQPALDLSGKMNIRISVVASLNWSELRSAGPRMLSGQMQLQEAQEGSWDIKGPIQPGAAGLGVPATLGQLLGACRKPRGRAQIDKATDQDLGDRVSFPLTSIRRP